MAKTMVAKYKGICLDCDKAIVKGSVIVFAGRGRAYHEGCAGTDSENVHYGYTSTGRGRCEDAPCCGCCD